MARFFPILAFLLLAALPVQAQLQIEDAFIATSQGIEHIRAGASMDVTPNATDGNPIVAAQFGAGAIIAIPGSQLVLYAEGAGSFGVYLLDFLPGAGGVGTGIMGPASTLIGNAMGPVFNLAYDEENDVAYVMTNAGDIQVVTGPNSPTPTLVAAPFATGQTGIAAIAVAANGQLLGASQSSVWPINGGDMAVNPSLFSFNTPGCSDMIYDATANRLIVSTFGGNRIDIYDAGNGALLSTPIMSPSLLLNDGVGYNPGSDTIYALSRFATTLGGIPAYGNNSIGAFDNVLACTTIAAGTAGVVGCSPQGGHGNSGSNASMALVTAARGSIEFDPASNAITFDTINNTLSASLTVQTVRFGGVITSSAVDPLVGAIVEINADYTGLDTVGFSDIALTNATVSVYQTTTPPGTPDVIFSAAVAMNAGATGAFGGPRNATPMAVVLFELATPMITTNGGTSSALTGITNAVNAGSRIGFNVDLATGGILTLGLDPNASAAPYEMRIGTSGNGDLEIGTIGAFPNRLLYHIGTTMTASPLGSGSFLGLTPDTLLFDQLLSPFFTDPYVVLADNNGQYNFFLPAGFVAAGISLDYVGIRYDNVAILVDVLAPKNVTF